MVKKVLRFSPIDGLEHRGGRGGVALVQGVGVRVEGLALRV